jgi:hypothetical protein
VCSTTKRVTAACPGIAKASVATAASVAFKNGVVMRRQVYQNWPVCGMLAARRHFATLNFLPEIYGVMSSATMRFMFHVVLECEAEGLSPEIGEQAATDIAEEFTHRPWHTNVRCIWDGHRMRLEADNDYDDKGLALRDEFSDAMVACVAMYERLGDMRIVSVTEY